MVIFKNTIKKDDYESKLYQENSLILITSLITTIGLPIASYFGSKAIDAKEIKAAQKIVYNKCFSSDYFLEIDPEETARDFIKYIEDRKYTGVCDKYRCKYDILKDLNIKCEDGKIKNLDVFKKAKAVFKSKMVMGLHAALSFLNLGWSIYELTQTYKGFEEIKAYKIRLKGIVSRFNLHKKEIGILPDDFKEAADKIKNTLEKIRQDQKLLKDLIKEIKDSIKRQEFQKKKSITGLVASGALGVFGIAGSIITSNATSFVYGVSSIANVISAIAHTSDIVMSSKIIDEFNKLIEEAEEEEKKIQNEIDRIINELLERIEQEPKFDLNSSISSISTQFYD